MAAATGGGLFLVEALVGGMTALGAASINIVPFGDTSGVVFVGLSAVALLVFGQFVAEATGRESTFGEITALIQAIAAVLLLGVFFHVFGASGTVGMLIWLVPTLAVVYIMWVYFGKRRQYTRSTALDRTQRDIGRTFEGWGKFTFGMVSIFVAAALGIISGVLSAGSGLGDVLMPYMGELAFLGAGASGYLAMGGELFGLRSPFLAQLTPGQWFVFVLLIGGLVVLFRR